ncbi:MAG TPA: SRPBCC family protein [Actinomycetota bacterium]|nr:SRPBCC family protein [Actinomycetota bacterium]
MTTIHRDTVVQADPERCFDFIADPSLAPLFLSSLYSITPIEVEPRGKGNRWGFEYDMFGVPVRGESECIEFDRPSRYVWRSDPATSTIETTFSYGFEPADGGTRVSLDVAYEVPPEVLGGKIADKLVVERMNEHEADAAINNLKVVLEEG